MLPEKALFFCRNFVEPLGPGDKTSIERVDGRGCDDFFRHSAMVRSDHVYDMRCFEYRQIVHDGGPADAAGCREGCRVEATAALRHEQFCEFEKG